MKKNSILKLIILGGETCWLRKFIEDMNLLCGSPKAVTAVMFTMSVAIFPKTMYYLLDWVI